MKTNIQTRKLISQLEKAGRTVPLWKRVAKELSSSTRRLASVNLAKVNIVVKEGETALVLGKVLGVGSASGRTVAAFQFSETARAKLGKGKALSLAELFQSNPQGKNVRLVR